MKKTKPDHIKTLTVTAMLCALAYLVTFVFHFKVMFLTFDLKDAVLTVTALLYGPIYGLLSSAVVAFLEFVTVSDTGIYGLIMNFLSSAAFSVTAGLIYKYKRRFAGAVLSVVMAAVAMTAVMLLANLFITPFYMHVPVKEVGAMIPTLLLPFNACKAVMNAAAVLLLYKPLISALRRMGIVKASDGRHSGVKSMVLAVVAVLLIAVTSAVLVLMLGGEAQWF